MTRQRAAYVDLTSMTPDEAQAAMKATTKKPHKYGARKTEYKGEVYDSQAEADYAADLDRKKLAGAIRHWERPKALVLEEGDRATRITYRPDFFVVDGDGHWFWVDVKGVLTEAFKIKARLLLARCRRLNDPMANTRLVVVKGGREYVYGEKQPRTGRGSVWTDPPAGSSLVQGAGE